MINLSPPEILAYMSAVAQVQISSLVMCVTVSASVALCLLFGPKMYLVLLHPEKCARTYPGNKKPTSNTKTNKVSTGIVKQKLYISRYYISLVEYIIPISQRLKIVKIFETLGY